MSILVVARWTVLEARRRRLVLAGVLLSVAFVALFAVGFALLYADQERSLSQAGPVPCAAAWAKSRSWVW